MVLENQEMEEYVLNHTTDEIEILKTLNRDTHANILRPRMLSGHLQGRILSMLSHMVKPTRILEIGTYTGYSAICLAEGLQPGGILTTIDINEELEEMAAQYFDQAGLSHAIQQIMGDAREIIPSLEMKFDMVFIDADKCNYPLYFDLVFDKVTPGGYIIADNILWNGKVIYDDPKDRDLNGVKEYNNKVKNHPGMECLILPIRDGLSIARKL